MVRLNFIAHGSLSSLADIIVVDVIFDGRSARQRTRFPFGSMSEAPKIYETDCR
jgi:hypothetical protein